MDVAYVTRHTYKRLSGAWLQPEGELSVDRIFEFIYEESLAPILNNPEALRLYVQKKMLDKDYQSLQVVKRRFSQQYVFSVSPPKFHKSDQCTYLTADFSNYLVPPAIKALGEDKVAEFQEFCEQTKKEFEGKSDEVIWTHVGVKFRVTINPESVLYANSGIQDVAGMTISELQQQIRGTVEDSLRMIGGDNSRTIKNFRYAPHMQKALSNITNPDVKSVVEQFFKLKWKLINTLFELYKKQAHADGYVLPVHLLQASGLEPCRGCWK